MLLLTLIIAIATMLSLTAAQEGTRTRPERATVYPGEPCGLITAGSPPIPTLTQCIRDAICTPKNTTCQNTSCAHTCVALSPCNTDMPCAAGYKCSPRGPPEAMVDGVCEWIYVQPPASSQNASGAMCGVQLPGCPSNQWCISSDPMCYSQDVCYGKCQHKPVYPPPKYPSCGGFTRKPNTCFAPNVCMDNPYGQGCGMACDLPGICVK